jgi:glutaminyl-peptide cyclotransferase
MELHAAQTLPLALPKSTADNKTMNRNVATSPARFSRKTLLLASVVAIAGGLAAWAWLQMNASDPNNPAAAVSTLKLDDIPFDGAQAYKYLKQLCAIGPRPSGSPGMKAEQKLLFEHFRKLGGQVEVQRFRVRHPHNDSLVPMTNIIVRWNPKSQDRLLLCAHYDTLPYPLMDRIDPRGTFVGANDNASGVAILMQLAHDMPKLKTKHGVDFLLLDGEEFIFEQGDRFFLGSEYFAREYAKKKPHYRWGVLLDMVGASNFQISPERNSAEWSDTRPLVGDIWAIAARLGVREFVQRPMYEVDDDHIMLHEIGHIPCIDVIQYMPNYPPWHTRADTPDKCSALSLAKVGWVIREWLQTAK